MCSDSANKFNNTWASIVYKCDNVVIACVLITCQSSKFKKTFIMAGQATNIPISELH